jgi:hypothetical protein
MCFHTNVNATVLFATSLQNSEKKSRRATQHFADQNVIQMRTDGSNI